MGPLFGPIAILLLENSESTQAISLGLWVKSTLDPLIQYHSLLENHQIGRALRHLEAEASGIVWSLYPHWTSLF